MTSVTIVVKMDDEMAGSAPVEEEQGNEDAAERRGKHIDDHRGGDHQAEVAVVEPEAGDDAQDERDDRAIEQADQDLAPDDPLGVVDVEVAGGERPHGDGHRLGP